MDRKRMIVMLKILKNRIKRKTIIIQKFMKIYLADKKAERVEKANNTAKARLFIACG